MNRDYELFGGSQDAAGSGSGLDARSQPIPKPTSFSRRALNGGGEDGALGYGGLSLHESMQIDSLALSHGAAHHSFAGSPFMTSSIPLLDHFRDISRGEAGSLGTSPRGQSFARSPIAGTPGLLLNRHAFTAIDHADSLGALDTDSLPGSPRHGRHYTSMFPLQPELSPVAAAHSIPHSGDLFGRPLRPGSILNEPLSPLSALGDSSAAPTGRLRSNSHILSPPPLLSVAGRSPGVDLGPGASSMLGAYSLNDAQGLPLRRPHDAEASIWDTYGGGLGKSLFDQQQSRWPPLASSVSALPASLHPSSFSTGLPAGGLRASLGESPMLGAIGQQRSQKQQQQKQGGLAASFAGLGSTGMFGRGSPHPGNASANGSSAASDHVDDLFELEQDAPANTRAGPGAALAPNPQFISMEGFGQMFSGLALARPENTANGSEPQPIATANPLSSGLSAISRPAA
ncbi:hypothetical protein H4R21_005916 [Coemansia helicoidea]|uniref:Uncharacterized protein n=1 Tax=Coemansia helicoidea TaxID=1286919 RepID=A0ACC1KQX9_9FUNG|nr:hypothetical protein H4R21_005916 [Coemansia helicoidea]